MEERLPFFADLEASRASVHLVVQTAVVNFVEWMRNPQSNVSYTAQAFEVVPQDLTRRIALRQTVEMVRITMEFFEEVVPLLARSEEQVTALTAGILRYSRDLAFAAATAYADAAEARGAWDTRMEANVVDAVVRGDTGPELQSQAAALNWDATAPATVVVGLPQPDRTDLATATSTTWSTATGERRCRMCTAPGWWPSCRVAFPDRPVPRRAARRVRRRSGGDRADRADADGAHRSATEAIAGMNAVGWSGAPRPVSARELLPERALLGDATAIAALDTEVMRPLADAGPADRDARRVPGLRRRDRGVRAQIVRSSKHRPLPAQTDRRLHRSRSHPAPRRLRAAGGRDRGRLSRQAQHSSTSNAGTGQVSGGRRARGPRACNRLRPVSMSRITCRFVGSTKT